MTPEGKVKAKGRQMCREAGWLVLPVNMTGIGAHGVPDDICCWQGKFISIEYKAHMRWTNKQTLPTVLQAKMMQAIRLVGGIPLVVDDDGLLYLRKLLDGRHTLENTPLRWIWNYHEYLRWRKGEGSLDTDTYIPTWRM